MYMKYFPHVLLGIYIILFTVCAINPYTRAIWINENLPVVLFVIFLVFSFKRFRFSNYSYIIIFIAVITQTIWWYYTFSRVPFDSVSHFFGFERNMFDRVWHFALWLYAFPIVEYVYRKRVVKRPWMIYILPIVILLAIASMYEITERLYTVYSSWANNAAFLGSQWDRFDPQADMLADWLWALVWVILFRFYQKRKWQ